VSRIGLKKTHDVVKRDRFSYAASTKDADRLARKYLKADVIKDVVVAEGLGDVLEVDVWVWHRT
jgi:CYTH domain-containing protein